jgi:hypothetical protein
MVFLRVKLKFQNFNINTELIIKNIHKILLIIYSLQGRRLIYHIIYIQKLLYKKRKLEVSFAKEFPKVHLFRYGKLM